MTQHETIEVEREGRVAIIRLNRPEKLNAMNAKMREEFTAALDEADADDGVGAMASTGNGRAYTSGDDQEELSDSRAQPETSAEDVGAALRSLGPTEWVLRKPIVGVINGIAVGMGGVFVVSLDAVIASTEARVGFPFTGIGLAPPGGIAWMLPRIVGVQRAHEMMLSARLYRAQEAHELGLFPRVVEPDELMSAAIGLAAEIAAHPMPTLRGAKAVMWDAVVANDIDGFLDASVQPTIDSFVSPEAKEATQAFLEKREPRFHDREYMRILEQPETS